MGIKRRFEIKKQQRWERRKTRKKSASKNIQKQPSSEKPVQGVETPPAPTPA